jgi:large subunit ribosomal protein L32e
MSKDFKRYGSHKMKRISPSWRKQRGLHNKVRLEHRGYSKKVKIGYGTPKDNKIQVIVVKNETDLLSLKGQKNITVLFSSKLGQKKKLLLFKKAKEMDVKISNIDDNYDVKVQDKLKQNKIVKEELKKKKESKQKEIAKKAEEKKKKDETKLNVKSNDKSDDKLTDKSDVKSSDKSDDKKNLTSDISDVKSQLTEKEKKDKEKKEKDKLLIKKDSL